MMRAVAIPHNSPRASAPKAAKSSLPEAARSASILRTVSGDSVPSARSFQVRAPSEASLGESGLTANEAAMRIIVTHDRRLADPFLPRTGDLGAK
jgi:hypothetical protein